MATTLHNVRLNFIAKLEAISPTSSIVNRGFENVDRIRMGADETDTDSFGNSSGRARDFLVKRLGSTEDRDPTRSAMREAVHEYEITVAYPTCLGLENAVHEIMDIDRNDILEALRDRATFTGIPGDGSATTGIQTRIRIGDNLEDDGAVWRQIYRFACRVKELT